MQKIRVIIFLAATVFSVVSFSTESLRSIYSKPPADWPKPNVDAGVQWQELGVLPQSPFSNPNDSLKKVIELGKTLFFDTRLSGSGKISCATCHNPEMNWTDGKEKSIGHEGAVTKRNAPTIQNTWFYKRLFWDGRSKDLQDQAFAPINSEIEMHSEMQEVMRKLSKSKVYKQMFKETFGIDEIDPFIMTEAIATFEKTITSAESRFDKFLKGDKRALSNEELKGLHIFRTKARCMNCHHGSLFTDNQFHKSIFKDDDAGFFLITHKEEDKGKFKTPSLRDVMNTAPWSHNGSAKYMSDVLFTYNKMSPSPSNNQPKMLYLTKKEIAQVQAFLEAISSAPKPFAKPVLPE